ncbi:ankyrin repeat domain-containing protein SOWAHC-like [Vombatus ursinus]|uniref:ankyrin repeat domain-containing protein SOWAHC-like n=1 Tax=Vombatus ursinus TaxID=29139 RepID=UPI000FFD45C8|nr:ankyrin repeat domain-containing protein SOWAHC-like [Vombatus ursinus]XP_027722156.1 ankyrin repeat domain-containing protein SOWAHC-like [Vombatus ursinus]
MEELGQEAVLLFLTQRGGRARNAELVEHFRGALGGEPEQRARAREHFKQLVNAVATVRTDPADGTKYVYLKKKFCGGGPPPPLHAGAPTPQIPEGGEPEAGSEHHPSPPAGPTDLKNEDARSPPASPGNGEPNPVLQEREQQLPPQASIQVVPSISVTEASELEEAPGSLDRANPATSNGPESPEGSAPPSAGDHPLPEGNPEESGPSADQESPPQLVSGESSRNELPRLGQVQPLGVGARRKNSRRNVPLLRGLPQGSCGVEDSEPLPRNWEEGDNCSSPGGVSTPRPGRKNLLDLMIGSSPQLKRSFFVGGNNLGGSTGGGRATRGGGDSDTASLASSSNEEEGSATGSVALDPLEHAWMLSASDGKWDSLEGLLTCEPGLLAKRDFITGFTCLHWAAKHGKQELLAMLVNFANKHHLPVNINARTSAGYTALHLAAMHGHVEVVKLLVGAYDADVDIRDYSGKKASQYLNQSIAEEIKNLVGALEDDDGESTSDSGGGRWKLSKVLPSHLITYKLSHVPEDGGDHHHHHSLADGSAGGKSVSRKALGGSSNSSRMRPRLNKIRFRTQIIHSTPSFRDPEQPLSEEERSLKSSSSTSSFKLRPKSNVFG